VLEGHETTASRSLFESPDAGELHLTPAAAEALRKVTVVAGGEVDWDGEPRGARTVTTVGADERAPR
jgi:hypothetical protein